MNKKGIIAVAMLAVLTAALVVTMLLYRGEGSQGAAGRKSRVYYEYFDTVTTLYDYSDDSDAVFDANAAAFIEELETCHKLFDIYNEYDGVANVATVNKNAGANPVKVDERLIELLVFSKEMYKKTNGTVNVAMGAVLRIWHEYREAGVGVPSEDELRLAAEHCDIDDVVIDVDDSTVYLADPEMALDLGAVAKGFAIDCTVKVLKARGADSYAVDVGGNLYAIGAKPNGEALRTGISNPLGGDYSAIIEIANGSVATSGDYQRYYTVGGVRYHHIIDPKTLFPASVHRSVSVYSDSAALSDALSTALFVMSAEDAGELISKAFPTVRQLVFVGNDGVGKIINM